MKNVVCYRGEGRSTQIKIDEKCSVLYTDKNR